MEQIKNEKITLKTGKKAILSTAKLSPNCYETMLASPDFDTEYVRLQTTNKEQAIADFNYLRKQYHVEPLSGKYAKLARDLKSAATQALEVAAKTDDGGTCNLDSVIIALKGWNGAKVQEAAKQADVGCHSMFIGRQKSYVLVPKSIGQANARTAAVEAMRKALRFEGYDTSMYYQID